MSIFTPDFTKVESAIPTYPKGRYRVKITKLTPGLPVKDARDEETGQLKKVQQRFVRYALEMMGRIDDKGELQTKDEEGQNLLGRSVTSYTVWLHTEGGWKFAKPFLMAAGGFSKNQENEANTKLFQAHEWFIKGEEDAEPENIQLGDGYKIPVGKVLDVTLSIKKSANKDPNEPDYENQDFNAWTPVREESAKKTADKAASSKTAKATASV